MAGRQTRRQLQFTGFEMAVLGVSFVVTVTAVFFLGLFVGKRNAWHHAPAEDRVARIPVDDFTKYKRPAPLPAAPKPAEVASAAPAAAPVPGAAKEAAAPLPTPAAKAAPAAPVPAPSEVEPKTPDAAAKAAAGDTAATAKEAAAKEAEAKKLADAKKAAEAKKKEEEQKAEPSGGGYTVQLLSTRKEADADALVRKLKARGYAAYIRKTADGAGAWYRVRVGSYGSFSDARAMADKCRGDLGLAQAFVSTE